MGLGNHAYLFLGMVYLAAIGLIYSGSNQIHEEMNSVSQSSVSLEKRVSDLEIVINPHGNNARYLREDLDFLY